MSKKGSTGLTIIANIFSLFVSIFISFFITKYIVEYIGKEVYSFYPTSNNFATYFSIIFFASNSLASRLIINPYLKGDNKEASEYYSTVFISCLILSILVFILELIFYFNMERILDIPTSILSDVKLLFLLVFIGSIVSGIGGVFACVFYVKNRMDLYAISAIAESLTRLLLIIILMHINKLSLVSMGLIMLIATSVRYILTFIYSSKYMNDIKIKTTYFSINKFKQVFSLGFMSIISNSGSLLISNSQLIISNMALGIEKSSDLSLVQPLVTVCLLLGSTVSVMIDPLAIRNVLDDDEDIKYVNYILVGLMIVPMVLIMTLNKQLYSLWLPNEDYNLLFKLSFLSCFAIMLSYMTYINSSCISTFLKEGYKAKGVLVSYFIYAFLIYVFIGLENDGILLASIITYVLYFIIYIPLMSYKLLKDNKKNIRIEFLKNIIYAGLIIFINVLLSKLFALNSIVNFILMCIVATLIDYLLMILIYKINIKETVMFLKGNKND